MFNYLKKIQITKYIFCNNNIEYIEWHKTAADWLGQPARKILPNSVLPVRRWLKVSLWKSEHANLFLLKFYQTVIKSPWNKLETKFFLVRPKFSTKYILKQYLEYEYYHKIVMSYICYRIVLKEVLNIRDQKIFQFHHSLFYLIIINIQRFNNQFL